MIGGQGTEQQVWFVQLDINGVITSDWALGPDLPLFRQSPLVGRIFWRRQGITSFGVSNCASIAVCGGTDENDKIRREIQLLIRNSDCNWQWVTRDNNPSGIPDDILFLVKPVTNGASAVAPFPETLLTGGRLILFGGDPEFNNGGSTQFGQFRFFEGKYQRDPILSSGNDKKTAWNITTSMPNQRTFFKALPLNQTNESSFGGRRVSRFLCPGGRTSEGVTDRVQLFQLPTPPPWVTVVRNTNR